MSTQGGVASLFGDEGGCVSGGSPVDTSQIRLIDRRTLYISEFENLHLETQLAELDKRRVPLTKRIDALRTDIGRELDSERRLVLK